MSKPASTEIPMFTFEHGCVPYIVKHYRKKGWLFDVVGDTLVPKSHKVARLISNDIRRRQLE